MYCFIKIWLYLRGMNNNTHTNKDLAKKLVSKVAGCSYVYEINNTRFEICEFNNFKGWCLNEYTLSCLGNMQLVNSCGYNGFLLRECKESILNQWNESNGYTGGIK